VLYIITCNYSSALHECRVQLQTQTKNAPRKDAFCSCWLVASCCGFTARKTNTYGTGLMTWQSCVTSANELVSNRQTFAIMKELLTGLFENPHFAHWSTSVDLVNLKPDTLCLANIGWYLLKNLVVNIGLVLRKVFGRLAIAIFYTKKVKTKRSLTFECIAFT